MPSTTSGPVTVSPSSSWSTRAPNLGEQVAQRVAGLGGAQRPAGDRHPAAGDHGRGQERRRRWTGPARWPAGRTSIGPGSTRQVISSTCSTSAPAARSIATVMSMWAPDGSLPPTCRTSRRVGAARRREQQGADELRGHRRVEGDAAAEQPAPAVHGERQPVVGRRRRRRRGRAARRTTGASGRWWDRGSPSNAHVAVGERRHRGQEAHHGAGVPDVDRRRADAAAPG